MEILFVGESKNLENPESLVFYFLSNKNERKSKNFFKLIINKLFPKIKQLKNPQIKSQGIQSTFSKLLRRKFGPVLDVDCKMSFLESKGPNPNVFAGQLLLQEIDQT